MRLLEITEAAFPLSFARWLELLAFGILAYDLTASPSLVALVALLRFVPMALCSAVIGALADQMDPRRMLMVSLLGITVVAIAMLGLQLGGSLSYWHVCGAALASGVYWASDMPIRRKMMGEIAGPKRLSQAMSWDYATSNGTRMVGPLLGGVLYQNVGMDGVFVIVLAHYVAAIMCAWRLKPTGLETVAVCGKRSAKRLRASGLGWRKVRPIFSP